MCSATGGPGFVSQHYKQVRKGSRNDWFLENNWESGMDGKEYYGKKAGHLLIFYLKVFAALESFLYSHFACIRMFPR